MSYTLYKVRRDKGSNDPWVTCHPHVMSSWGCLASFTEAMEELTLFDTDDTEYGVAVKIQAPAFDARFQAMLESKLLHPSDVAKNANTGAYWYSSDTFSAAPVFTLSDTYDDIHYRLLPYRLMCERSAGWTYILSIYSIDQLEGMTPRQVKALNFAANMLKRVNGLPTIQSGYHQSNFSRFHFTPLNGIRVSTHALSALINSDAYYRKRIPQVNNPIRCNIHNGYPVGDRVLPDLDGLDNGHGLVPKYILANINRWFDELSLTQQVDYLVKVYHWCWGVITGKYVPLSTRYSEYRSLVYIGVLERGREHWNNQEAA